MFSKTIFKQTVKANRALWIIFTAILTLMMVIMVASYDPEMLSTMTKALEGTPMAEMAGDQLSSMLTLLGSIGTSYYGMFATILPLIFIIIVANKLVAAEVDRGSMAYTLSTPITRTSVIFTKAVTLISSLVFMFVIVACAGIFTVQIAHGAVWGVNYSADVEAVAKELDMDKADVADDLSIILESEKGLQVGADARGIDTDVYTAYLTLAIQRDTGSTEEQSMPEEQLLQMQENLMAGLNAAANTLDMDVSKLSSDMGVLKENNAALTAACDASGMPEQMFVGIVNQQLASGEITKDEAIEFDMSDFIMLNVGAFLLMFAISGISFLASSKANLSKHSLAFGAGIPIAFYLFSTLSQTSDSLESFKYFSLNTLYDASSIAGGTVEVLPLVILGVIGILLYGLSIQAFKRKDLPL